LICNTNLVVKGRVQAQQGAEPWELAAENPARHPRLPQGVSPAQLAAWTAVSRVLLNLDETIT
jgi:hypothetical protein